MFQCCSPYQIQRKKNIKTPFTNLFADCYVPCGKCLFCRIKLARDRFSRILFESFYNLKMMWCTLTYSEDNVWRHAVTGKLEHNYSHFQNFMKRLRVALSRKNFKDRISYVCVSEYGSSFTCRPHFHVIIFGLDNQYARDVFRAWSKGHVHFGYITSESIGYTANYCLKDMKDTIWKQASGFGFRTSLKLGHKMIPVLINYFKKIGIQRFIKLGEKRIVIPKGIFNKICESDPFWRVKKIRDKMKYAEINREFFRSINLTDFCEKNQALAENILEEQKKKKIIKELVKNEKIRSKFDSLQFVYS